MKTALSIGGSDSCGGAGIQADLKTFTVLGVYGMSAITAITAQNTTGVKEILELDPKLVAAQIEAVASDIQADACKSGMLANSAIAEAVADSIRKNKLAPYVCDPVMFAKTGGKLLKDDAIDTIKKKIIPLATVITPNRREAAALTGANVDLLINVAAAKDAAKRLHGLGPKTVIITGIEAGDQMVDLFFDGKEFVEFGQKTQPKEKTHGAGCIFAAAIAAGLANRLELIPAIDQAKQVVTHAIQYGDGQGRGVTPANVIAFAPKKK